MIWPSAESPASRASARAMVCAATLMAGLSRKLPTFRCEVRRDLTSCSSAASPAHAWRRKSSRRSKGISSADCNRSSICFQRSASIAVSATHFAVKPGPGGAPVAHHSDRRHLEHFRGFLHAQTTKEAQLNHVGLSRIDAGKSLYGIVDDHQVVRSSANHRCVFQSNVLDAAPTFQIVAPCVVNQNPPHQLRRNGKKVGAILPAHALVIHQPQVSFVDQGGGL